MKRIGVVFLVLLVILLFTSATFGAGFALGKLDLFAEPQARTPVQEVAAGPVCDVTAGRSHDVAMPPACEQLDEFDTFWEAWDLVHERFIDREALDEVELEYGAIEGMVEALGDEGHTTFLTPEELARQRSDISGKFSGIGAYVGVRDGLPMIVAPFDGSPADQAGVKAGDLIIEVDGKDVTAWSLGDVIDHIRGEEGTEVVLTLLRTGTEESESEEITIVRGEITVPAAEWAMLPGTDVALIRLSQFSANATEELLLSYRQAREAGANALIVDVRNNPGGLLEQAVRVTSQFLTKGNVLQQEDAAGHRQAYPVLPGGKIRDIPLVVLTNRGSASSSEIFAGAIQDHERGLVVGETTFGTGTVLEPFVLEDGSGLMLGTSQWLTSNGRLIRKQGIEPDVTVELPISAELLHPRDMEDLTVSDLLKSEDAQLLKALELLYALPAVEAEAP